MSSLEVRHLAVAYGDAPAVWDATLQVGPGEVVAVIGPNGAGKSTLVNTIAGLQRSRGGELSFGGVDLCAMASHLVCRQGIALVPEGRRLFTRMSVEENLEMGAYRGEARRARGATLERVYGLFPILRERRRQLAGALSGGEQRLLAIARALIVHPRLLLLDEPSAALAPRFIDQVYATLVALNRDGLAMLIVEQNVEAILAVAHRVFVLDLGRNAFDGTPAELRGSDRIRRLYLGEEEGEG